MTPGTLDSKPFGPFVKGVIDKAEPSQGLDGIARRLVGLKFSGGNLLSTRDGTRVVLTLKDDAGPANITSVCCIEQFTDGALVVGHSTITDKCYLYRLNATLDTWTDSGGTTHTNSTPEPVAVIWSSIPDSPDVFVSEELGIAYIAHTQASSSAALTFPLKSFDDITRMVASVTSDLDSDTSAESLYALGCIPFQQHLWIWGVGAGTTATNHFRPEMARFSKPNLETSGPPHPGDLFAPSDSITLGNRVRSLREGIVCGCVAGESLYLGAPFLVTRITGYGRSSWQKTPLNESYGFVGPKCATAAGSTIYYWSPRGPVRIPPGGAPDPIFAPIQSIVDSVVNPQKVVAGFDSEKDCVIFAFDTGAGVRTMAVFDTVRDVWLGPNDDIGVVTNCMGTVTPILQSTAAATLGPAGPPTSASTTSVGSTTATANWSAGDLTAQTQVEIRQQGGSSWTVVATVGAGLQTYTFTGLTASTDYEWRAAHSKDGQLSTYLGPVVGSQFTTGSVGGGLLAPTSLAAVAKDDDGNTLVLFTDHANLNITWANSGETDADTIVELQKDGAGYVQQYDAYPGQASTVLVVTVSGSYDVRIKHSRSGYTDSTYDGPVSLTVSIAS